jgi:leucyl aminopeptidase
MRFLLQLFVVLGCWESLLAFKISPDLRCIEFNETYREWMPMSDVEKLAQECGKKGHGGFIDITDHPFLSSAGISDDVRDRLAQLKYPINPTHQKYVTALFPGISQIELQQYNDKLSSFFTRYYTTDTGRDAASFIKAEFEKGKAKNPAINVEFFSHSWKQPSVIARIPGQGDLADELVIIGAHEDSINGGATGRAPGADDDASGSSTVLEAFRVLVAAGYQPQRTVEFHTYSAEEVGLRGSQDIAAKYQKDGKVVYSMMQLDMTLYTKSGTTPQVGIITDYVNADLTAFLRKLVTAYSTLKSVDSQCGYGCSDHASWTKAGFSSCFPFESSFANRNSYIHSTQDDIAKLNIVHGVEFVKLALGFIVELSDASN